MPINNPDYTPPMLFTSRHLQTIIPSNFRKVNVNYSRQRISIANHDFIDIDWSKNNSEVLGIVLHGYGGHSHRDHVMGMVKILNDNNIDAVAVNLRGQSGEPNNSIEWNHAGCTDDIKSTIDYINSKHNYKTIYLIGFSLGGNIILNYIGKEKYPSNIKKVATISVPCDLKSSSENVSRQFIYNSYFLSKLKVKIQQKSKKFPAKIDFKSFKTVKNLLDFDDLYTVKIHGFNSLDEYYNSSSCNNVLGKIDIPTMILNAEDDPFLGPKSYPREIAKKNKNLFLEIPKYGGHTGFVLFNKENEYWSEKYIINFLLD